MDRDSAKALLIANLKGSRRKRSPLVKIARAVRLLKNDKEYGSARKLAKAFDVSRSIIESFDRILDHPTKIKALIGENKILLDASTKLFAIHDIPRRIEIAEAIAGETAFDSRYIIDYAKKHPHLSARECKKAIMASKDITEETHVIVVPLDAQLFKAFRGAASAKKLTLQEASKTAIKAWLDKGGASL